MNEIVAGWRTKERLTTKVKGKIAKTKTCKSSKTEVLS